MGEAALKIPYGVQSEPIIKTNFKAAYWFCGIGGGEIGFSRARAEYAGAVGKFETLHGIDCDPEACEDFETLTGAPALQLDLFSRDQYTAFHGQEPPEDWREVTGRDIYDASEGVAPDVIFMSPPCKGFSGLLPEQSAKSRKYQALNQLVVRSMRLIIDAYGDDLPSLILIENVPRITTRGAQLLDQVKGVLKLAGYVFHEGTHECGQMGGMAQIRKRYLLIARLERKMPTLVYKPPSKSLKTIGDVIGPLPMPGDTEAGGPMHKLPRLQWKVWMRLAMIPPGGDWRDLEKIDHTEYRLTHSPRNGAWGVASWDEPCGAVTGGAGVGRSNGVQAIADMRAGNCSGNRHTSHYAVHPYDGQSGTVTGATHVANGRICVEDVRLKERASRHPEVYRIIRWDSPGATVTGSRVGSGGMCIADERPAVGGGYTNKHKVLEWGKQATTVTGTKDIQCGAQSIADPRPKDGTHSRPHDYGVLDWKEQSPTVRGAGRIMNSKSSIADPRINCSLRAGAYGVQDYNETGGAVTGSLDVHQGAAAVADPRIDCKPRAGTYGVQAWDETSKTIIGSGDIHAGAAAVADERAANEWRFDEEDAFVVPADTDRGIWIILSPHGGAWHRPLTTLELAILQSFDRLMRDGRPLQLCGKSDARWRERIGNAVPPLAAEAMGDTFLISLMAASENAFLMSAEEIWVMPDGYDILPEVYDLVH